MRKFPTDPNYDATTDLVTPPDVLAPPPATLMNEETLFSYHADVQIQATSIVPNNSSFGPPLSAVGAPLSAVSPPADNSAFGLPPDNSAVPVLASRDVEMQFPQAVAPDLIEVINNVSPLFYEFDIEPGSQGSLVWQGTVAGQGTIVDVPTDQIGQLAFDVNNGVSTLDVRGSTDGMYWSNWAVDHITQYMPQSLAPPGASLPPSMQINPNPPPDNSAVPLDGPPRQYEPPSPPDTQPPWLLAGQLPDYQRVDGVNTFAPTGPIGPAPPDTQPSWISVGFLVQAMASMPTSTAAPTNTPTASDHVSPPTLIAAPNH